MHPEDSALRRVQDRRAQERAVNAAIRDRENAALQVFDFDFPFARLGCVIGNVALEIGETFLVGVADHGHDQAALGADGDADVEVIVLNEVVAFDPAVDRRHFF